jgi:hypothetical protein
MPSNVYLGDAMTPVGRSAKGNEMVIDLRIGVYTNLPGKNRLL